MWSRALLVLAALSFPTTKGEALKSDVVDTSRAQHAGGAGAGEQRMRHSRETEEGECVLPPYPAHGTYVVSGAEGARPGDRHESFALRVSCHRGYGALQPAEPSTPAVNATHLVFCDRGTMFHAMPKCVKFCELRPDLSIRYKCHVAGTGFRACGQFVAPGTAVKPICNSPNYYSSENLLYMQCIAGSWDYVAQCKPECGRITPDGVPLASGGVSAKRGELPWHAGVYSKSTSPYMQICGGSLVSNNVVISAAHCFWDDVLKQLPAADFAVAIGKIYRPWDNEVDHSAQKSDVKEIRIPSLFQGVSANFQEDIAVVIISTPFIYKTYVRPVCLNFDTSFDKLQLQQGKFGKVAGWGLVSARGKASSILKVVNLPYINVDTCIDVFPSSFREYVTGDKFCAGYTNGTALCQGDSGGGLTVVDKELGVDRYYLRGVVSAAPPADHGVACNVRTYTTFTRITNHEDLIKEVLASSAESKSCSSAEFQCADGACVALGADCNGIVECADGSDESEELCSAIDDAPVKKCVLPPYPEHGTYRVQGAPHAQPGDARESFLLRVTCAAGYEARIAAAAEPHSYCLNGLYNDMPQCVALNCTSEGVNGTCLPLHKCPSAALAHIYREAGYGDDRIAKSPAVCSQRDNLPVVCCTDCDVSEEEQYKDFVVRPPGILVKSQTGSKSRDKCLEYYHRLPYRCRARGDVSLTRTLDERRRCHTYELRAPRDSAAAPPSPAPSAAPADRHDVPYVEYPHMAVIGLITKKPPATHWVCSGAIISERYVLTAASCLENFGNSKHVIAVNVAHRNDSADWTIHELKNRTGHSKFSLFERYNDIALLETEEDIIFNENVLPICLDSGDTDTSGGADAVGWGQTAVSGYPTSDNLKLLHVDKLTDEECKSSIKANFWVSRGYEGDTQTCYSARGRNITGRCQADYGGALVHEARGGVHTAVGVTTYATACASEQLALYTRVAHYVPWIENIVWPSM